jgi:diguanylate cyclase (GGDEF)-like protein
MPDHPVSNETQILSLADLHGSQKNTGIYFTLTVIEGINFGYIFHLDKAETVIGRKDNDANRPDIELEDERASRRHIILVKRQNENGETYVVVADLGSKNGTFINNKRLLTEEDLRNGDKLQLGNSVLKFEVKDTLDTSAYQERLYNQVARDQLTNLWNHNHAKKEMERLCSVGLRHSLPFSLLLLEIDFFQTLNESYGQAVGDAVLRAIAQKISFSTNTYDLVARFGGNKFLIIFPETDMAAATNSGEQIRQLIENTDLSEIGCPQKVTLSGGVAQFPICGEKPDELLKKVDDALFQAKQVGRNRLVAAEISFKQTSQSKIKIFAVIGIVFLVVIMATLTLKIYPMLFTSSPKNYVYSGTVETHEVLIGSKVGGRVTEVLVQEGDIIKTKQALVRFDIAELLAQEKSLLAKIAQSEANLIKLKKGFRDEEIAEADANVRKEKKILEQLKNGPRPQEIAKVRADLAAAQSDLFNAEVSMKRIEEVYNNGYFPKQSRDDAENRVNLGKSRVEALKQELALLEEGTRLEEIQAQEEKLKQAEEISRKLHAGTRTEDIEAATADLEAIKAELVKLKVLMAEGEISAPNNGQVQVIRIRPGDIVPPGKAVMEILEKEQTWVKVYVPQTEIGNVYIGQRAYIIVESLQNDTLLGLVKQISQEAEFYPRNVQTHSDREHQVFGVKVYLDKVDPRIKSGMSADVKLEP